jgi:hypothetical protein
MDFDEITLGEIEEIEEFADASLSEIGDDSKTATKLRIGLAWILKRRENPNFTIDDAKKMKMSEVMEFLGESSTEKK